MIWIFNTYYANFVRIDVICNLIILKTLYKYIELIFALSLNNENLYQ